MSEEVASRINLSLPRYDQSTFLGRAKHFFITTNPLNVFASSEDLNRAKLLLQQYKEHREPAGTSADQVWQAKHLYDSAFHPDTGEKMFILGRMSAQVPMNMTITGCMMTFYRTAPAVIFWQWFNQSFNAIVNYTNRSGDSPIPVQRLALAYTLATGAATGTALTLNTFAKHLPPLIGKYIPFAAVVAANCINIPCMRNSELKNGVPVFTETGEMIGNSPIAAKKAIREVVISRIVMAMPGMILPPILMVKLEKGLLKRYPVLAAPIQVGLIGVLLIFATPLCCAIFPQKSSISVNRLEPELQDKVQSVHANIDLVYFNKGL